MAVSFEIILPTWLLAASLASLFALLVWRTSDAEAKGELAEPPEQKTKDEPPERPQDALGAEQKAKDERTSSAPRGTASSTTGSSCPSRQSPKLEQLASCS